MSINRCSPIFSIILSISGILSENVNLLLFTIILSSALFVKVYAVLTKIKMQN